MKQNIDTKIRATKNNLMSTYGKNFTTNKNKKGKHDELKIKTKKTIKLFVYFFPSVSIKCELILTIPIILSSLHLCSVAIAKLWLFNRLITV